MTKRQQIADNQLENVSGGVSKDNNWGDYTVYKIGKNGGAFTHTFKDTDLQRVNEIIVATARRDFTPQQNEDAIMAALIAEPGLLTPIE